ncbi:uncharacterized protein ACMZJ9_007655 [Mantella aurantiaca]
MAVLETAKNNNTKDIAMLDLDAEKAFDNVHMPRLFMVMEKFGISGKFLTFLKKMYSSPRARVCTAGVILDPLHLPKGMRHGCPLSPLLFTIAFEPLA